MSVDEMNGQGRLLKIDEAADVLRVPRSWLYEQTRRGTDSKVPHVRIGRYVRFRVDDLHAWIASNAVGGREERPA